MYTGISGGSRICEQGGPGIKMPRFLRHLHLHYGVGVPAAYQTDLRGEKKIKEKKEEKKLGGGGAAADSAPLDPPLGIPRIVAHLNVSFKTFYIDQQIRIMTPTFSP